MKKKTAWLLSLVPTLAMLSAQEATFAQGAPAPNYPTKPIHMVHSFQAGGITDVLGRVVGQKMQESLGQNVLVEPRPGGGGNIGAEVVARSAPDGYTIYLGIDGTMAMGPYLEPKPSFDPLRDFTFLTLSL